jgi:hypothetical protein
MQKNRINMYEKKCKFFNYITSCPQYLQLKFGRAKAKMKNEK